jgi:hypothetical protein
MLKNKRVLRMVQFITWKPRKKTELAWRRMLAQHRRDDSVFLKLVRYFLSEECTVAVHLLENSVQSTDATLNIEASADMMGIYVKKSVKLKTPLKVLQTLMHEFVHFLRAHQMNIDPLTREYLTQKYLDISQHEYLKPAMIREEQLALWVEMNLFRPKHYNDIKKQMENIYCSSSDYESHCNTVESITNLIKNLIKIQN